jgi:hexosaminidase
MSAADPSLLWPPPQTTRGGLPPARLPATLPVRLATSAEGALDLLVPAAAALGLRLERRDPRPGETAFELMENEVGLPAEGYRLSIGPTGAAVRAGDPYGVLRGAATLAQWLRLHAGEVTVPGVEEVRLGGLEVEDWPDLPRRGVMLDVSRDKVPTLATLLALVDRLAGWKVNQLQLYLEHTFAYRGHEVVWRDASPLTPDDVQAIDARCRRLGIELVPNQNSFGHFHRWLAHEPYRELAEVPEGLEHPFHPERREPFSLCPLDPRSLDLLADLYDQLLPNFSSRELNVGLDETFDLGKGRSAAAVAERGKVRVYLDYVLEVHRLVRERGHRMQMWGDIILEQPELISELPRDVVALEWGYEADHPFADHLARFAASGLDFMVCPGTSSWCSLAGRADNALHNLAAAAQQARDNGAYGYLITDWGDYGHLQPLSVSFLGLLAGAGFSWKVASAAAPRDLPWPDLLALHAFDAADPTVGGAALSLADAYLHTGAQQKNGTALFYLVAFPQHDLEHRRYGGLSEEGLDGTATRVEEAAAALRSAAGGSDEERLSRRELLWVAGLLRFACRLGTERLRAGRTVAVEDLPPDVRSGLAAELAPLVAEHETVWLLRNRPGGRRDSVARLERLAALLGA